MEKNITLQTRFDAEKTLRAANLLKAVAHPVRMSIVDMLDVHKRLTVSELYQTIGVEQSLVSHHLSKLRDKGIVAAERQGQSVFYTLENATVMSIIRCLNACPTC